MILEADKSKMKVLVWTAPGESSLSDLLTSYALTQWKAEASSKLSSVSLCKGTNPITGAPPT